MCYKVAVKSSVEVLEHRFQAKANDAYDHRVYYHANGFANPLLPVITQKAPNEIQGFEWGMIPRFAKNSADAKKLRAGNLNARNDTIFDKVTWKKSIIERRCIILADAYYESMDVAGVKYPHMIYREDLEPFAFAGVYDAWKDENEIWHPSFAIVTTDPNELNRRIHNIKQRMPVILPREFEKKWLQPDLLQQEIKDLMIPLEDGILKAHPVSKLINQNKQPTNEAWIMDVAEYPELNIC